MNPIRNLNGHCFSFLQKENIRSDLCSCVLLKSSIRKSDSSQQVTAFSKVSSCLFIQLVHSELACDKCNNSTRLHFINRLCGKVIVYLEIMLIVGFIADTVISERDITNNNIKTVVIERSLLKAFNLNTLLWIELLCDSARNAVQLHTVKAGIVTHIFRHFREEIAYTHTRFKDITALKTELRKCLIYTVGNFRRCIEACER